MKLKDSTQHLPIATILWWLSDSRVWMQQALYLERQNRSLSDDVMNDSYINVAYSAVGIALELLFKALALASGQSPRETHSVSTVIGHLPTEMQTEVHKRIDSVTGLSASYVCQYLDHEVCDPNRKYRMMKAGRRLPGGGFSGLDALSIPTFGKLHQSVYDMIGRAIFADWNPSVPIGLQKPTEPVLVVYPQEDGSSRYEVTETGKQLGFQVGTRPKNPTIVCPKCRGREWNKPVAQPKGGDTVVCRGCGESFRAGHVLAWNKRNAYPGDGIVQNIAIELVADGDSVDSPGKRRAKNGNKPRLRFWVGRPDNSNPA